MRIVEQVPVSAEEAEAVVVAEANGRVVERVEVPVTVPVLEGDDSRNPFIVQALADVRSELLKLGPKNAPRTNGKSDTWDGPIPTAHAAIGFIKAYAKAQDESERHRMLIKGAASLVAFAARRKEDRCRVFSQAGQSNSLV